MFEVWAAVFQVLQTGSRNELAKASEADLSMGAIKTDILSFIPGVTASAGCFVLFGTTAPLRGRYRSWFGFLAPRRLCMCCFAGERKRREGQGQLEQGPCEIGQHSPAELATSSLRIRVGAADNPFVDVWPENPNFITNHLKSSPLPVRFHSSTEFNPLAAGTSSINIKDGGSANRNTIGGGCTVGANSDIAGPQPFSLVLPSPPGSIRSPVEITRTSSPSPSLLQHQQQRLMRGDAVFFAPLYLRSAG